MGNASFERSSVCLAECFKWLEKEGFSLAVPAPTFAARTQRRWTFTLRQPDMTAIREGRTPKRVLPVVPCTQFYPGCLTTLHRESVTL
jgi:hypothetical protein